MANGKNLEMKIAVVVIVEENGKFLMTIERNKSSGEMFLTQPGGHVEKGETYEFAARREVFEETGYLIDVHNIVGIYSMTRFRNGAAYMTICYRGTVNHSLPRALVSDDIETHWLTIDEIVNSKIHHRNPLVLERLNDYRRGNVYPLDLVKHYNCE